MTLLTPLAGSLHYTAVIVLRFFIGFVGVSMKYIPFRETIVWNLFMKQTFYEQVANKGNNSHSYNNVLHVLGRNLSSIALFDLPLGSASGKRKIHSSAARGHFWNCHHLAYIGSYLRRVWLGLGFLHTGRSLLVVDCLMVLLCLRYPKTTQQNQWDGTEIYWILCWG